MDIVRSRLKTKMSLFYRRRHKEEAKQNIYKLFKIDTYA